MAVSDSFTDVKNWKHRNHPLLADESHITLSDCSQLNSCVCVWPSAFSSKIITKRKITHITELQCRRCLFVMINSEM